MKPRLVALRVGSSTPRYLDKTSDSPKLLWKVGNRKPRDGTDFKQAARKHGGYEPFHVRRSFLKEVLKARYPEKLVGSSNVNHGPLVSFSLVFANIRQFAECGRAASGVIVRGVRIHPRGVRIHVRGVSSGTLSAGRVDGFPRLNVCSDVRCLFTRRPYYLLTKVSQLSSTPS